MKEGDVIVVPMPQADGMVKNRPAIVLREMPPFGDVLVCGVSTQLRQAAKDFDEVISKRSRLCVKRLDRRVLNQARFSGCGST
jgi:hypothetical protein